MKENSEKIHVDSSAICNLAFLNFYNSCISEESII